MKIKIILFLMSASLLVLSSCESHEKKVDDAYERVKESKKNFRDTVRTVVNTEKPAEKIKVVLKNETVDEWTLFKTEIDNKIIESENKIRELIQKRNASDNKSKFDRQITRLEQKNNDLRKRMNDYHEEVKVKWEKFKVGMHHDIDAIGIELKDVTINNKKVKK